MGSHGPYRLLVAFLYGTSLHSDVSHLMSTTGSVAYAVY